MFLAMDLSAQYKVGSAVSFQDKDGMSHRAILVRADKIGTRLDTMPVRMNDPRMIIDYLKEGRAGVYRTLGREIGRAHVSTPVTNAHLVCRLLLEKKKNKHDKISKNKQY